jgi:hypothetical protein
MLLVVLNELSLRRPVIDVMTVLLATGRATLTNGWPVGATQQ